MIIGVLFSIILIALAIWQITSRWQVYWRLKRSGLLVQARVTDIKSESRLVTQLGGRSSTSQRLKYEDFLYAQWQDPLTQQIYSFRIRIPDFHQFSIGEEIPVKMNLHNPNEYLLQYSSNKRSTQKAMPKSDTTYPDYRQGYQVDQQETNAQTSIELASEETYEKPESSYPQELQEQQ
ncbi:MAG: hypothetical protein JO031_14830 [Ktedonobacteraceae bacterium]|nr:hypothetical protein [Ktedonobacteraceae bacterium]